MPKLPYYCTWSPQRERLEIDEDFKQSVEFYDNQAQRVKDLVETIKPSYN